MYHSVDLEFLAAEDATVHVTDLGLRRGFAAFDFFRLADGRPVFLEDHLDRFERTIRMLGLRLPVERERLRTHLFELIARNGRSEAGLQLFLTGGYADDGFTPARPNLIVVVTEIFEQPPERYAEGAKLILHRYQRDLPEAKTTNYSTAIRLIPTMKAAHAVDALYHDGSRLLETTRSNLFVVDASGHLVTPGRDVLEGVTRENVLRALEGEIDVDFRDVDMGELPAIEEAFITSTTKGVMPVRQIGDTVIGAGLPVPITGRVRERFAAHVQRPLEETPALVDVRVN
jgi:D-alanine transaminase/branched-chain amino acid aminotransferase